MCIHLVISRLWLFWGGICNLFRSQAFNWVNQGGADGLEADGDKGKQEGAGCGDREDPPGYFCAVGILPEP